MAKITVVGEAAVITSTLKLEDIKMVKKYRPQALTLMGGEDGKEPIFAIDTVEGHGGINSYGASFGCATRDDDKLACITMCMENVTGDVSEFLADKIGGALINLKALEEKLPGVVEEIRAEREQILESITLA